jgi:DNA-binding XRE family transcriptional regulator
MNGFVYAISAGDDLVKIGWSGDPMRRLGSIRTGCPADAHLIGLVPATKAQEAEIHKILAPWRLRREWFRRVGPVAMFVAALPPPKPALIAENLHPLAAYRKQHDLTQRDLAAQLSVARETVARWETGRRIDDELLPLVSELTGIARRILRPDLAQLLEKAA